jgi:hypothetical protein
MACDRSEVVDGRREIAPLNAVDEPVSGAIATPIDEDWTHDRTDGLGLDAEAAAPDEESAEDAVEPLYPPAIDGRGFAVVDGGTPLVVLDRADEGVAFTGRPTPVSLGAATYVLRETILSAAVGRPGIEGTVFAARDDSGRLCRAIAGPMELVARVQLSEEDVEQFAPESVETESERDAMRRYLIEELARDATLIAAPLDVEPGCGPVQWAHPATAAFPSWSVGSSGWLHRPALEAFRSLPVQAGLQAGFESIHDGHGRWDAHPKHRPTAHVLVPSPATAAAPAMVLVTANLDEGCGDFTGVLWAAIDADGVVHGYEIDERAPDAFADFDADGRVEAIFFDEGMAESATRLLDDENADRWADVSPASFDCGC